MDKRKHIVAEVGTKFGYYTVVKYLGVKEHPTTRFNGEWKTYYTPRHEYLFKCACGKTFESRIENVKRMVSYNPDGCTHNK